LVLGFWFHLFFDGVVHAVSRKGRIVSVELGVVEQRYQAVLEVLGGATVTDVARRYGVARRRCGVAAPVCLSGVGRVGGPVVEA